MSNGYYCYGKKDFCHKGNDNTVVCNGCEFFNDEGGELRELLINQDKSNSFEVKSNNELVPKENELPFVLTNEEKVSVKGREIEEMVKTISTCECNCLNCKVCYSWKLCEALYNAGYRKQSEGEWKKPSRYSEPVCTKCKKSPCQYFGMLPPFCPNCGAKMKGVEQ